MKATYVLLACAAIICVAVHEAAGYVDCRCEIPQGGPDGTVWVDVCELYDYTETVDECGGRPLDRDACDCCDVCGNVKGDVCHVYPAPGEPMYCADGSDCKPAEHGHQCM